MTEQDPFFIQINDARGLAFLQHFKLTGVNAYQKKRDRSEQYLVKLYYDPSGNDTTRPRPRPIIVVRCKTGALLGAAEAIVREKLGLAARIVGM